MKDGVSSSSFSLFMGSASAFVNLSCQFGETSFQVYLVAPTIGKGPHILLDSLRILFGNLAFAMDGEGQEALQLHRDTPSFVRHVSIQATRFWCYAVTCLWSLATRSWCYAVTCLWSLVTRSWCYAATCLWSLVTRLWCYAVTCLWSLATRSWWYAATCLWSLVTCHNSLYSWEPMVLAVEFSWVRCPVSKMMCNSQLSNVNITRLTLLTWK